MSSLISILVTSRFDRYIPPNVSVRFHVLLSAEENTTVALERRLMRLNLESHISTIICSVFEQALETEFSMFSDAMINNSGRHEASLLHRFLAKNRSNLHADHAFSLPSYANTA